jgi:hypothetical protein
MSAINTAIEVLICAAFGAVCGLVAYLVMRIFDVLSPVEFGGQQRPLVDVPRAAPVEFNARGYVHGAPTVASGDVHADEDMRPAVVASPAPKAEVRVMARRDVSEASPADGADGFRSHVQSLNPISRTREVQ